MAEINIKSKLKIAHILSDEKFIDRHIYKYKSSDFCNSYFYLKPEYNYKGKWAHQLQYIQPKSPAYFDLVQNIDQFDIVILYFLNWDKKIFVSDITASKVVVIWSFYGAEFYSIPPLSYKMLSNKTRHTLNGKWGGIDIQKIEDVLRSIIFFFKGKKTQYRLLFDVIKRINGFLWYNPYEYEFLNEYFNHQLPPYLPYSITEAMEGMTPTQETKNSVRLGNLRSPYNNHLDAIELLKDSHYKGAISIPFSYGDFPKYASKLKAVSRSSGLQIDFIEDFVPYEEYIKNLNDHSAAVFATYRQLGLGNVLIAVKCGIKIYLSEKNPTLPWLKSKGMKIFSLEKDLARDVRNDNLKLTATEMQINIHAYAGMVDPVNDMAFFSSLRHLVQTPINMENI